MKKLTLALTVAAFAAIVVPAAANAQTADIAVSAVIEAVFTVDNENDLDFGTITPGDGASVDVASADAGRLVLTHNSDVVITASPPATLASGTNLLPVTFLCGFSDTAGGAVATPDVCTSTPRAGNGGVRTSYFQMGGSILGADTAAAAAGTYGAVITFTVAATGL